jgi:hypothetical protein
MNSSPVTSTRPRRVLIVSPHFPPINAPDHQRVRMSLSYFREFGWEPEVLAVDEACSEGLRDPLLQETVPGDIPVHRCRAWPAGLTRRLGLGNIAYRAWFQLAAVGDRLLASGRFDLVYFSTTQFVATALGPRWQRKFHMPYIVDIQDPWRTDYYERPGAPRPPGGWKYRFARWQAERLEPKAWSGAAGFISVSDRYFEQLRERYDWFAAKPAAVVPFGAAERDFALARSLPGLAPAFAPEPGRIHLASVGAIGPIMRPALEQLFGALRTLRTDDPGLAARLRFHFVGTSYAAAGRAEPSVAPLAAQFGVADLVHESPERVGYFASLKTMLAADAIVIPGSDEPSYNPSKLANCFLAERPTLALPLAGSAMEASLRQLAFATIACFPAEPPNPAISDFLRRLADQTERGPAPARNLALFQSVHTARARTGQQCDLFDRALAAASPRRTATP